MRELDWVPDRVLCSTAARTRETWELLGEELGHGVEIEFEDAVYGASSGRLFRLVRETDSDVASLMLIGHNPGMEDLALALAGDGERETLRAMALKYPTAALAVLRADVDAWEDVEPQGFTLVDFVRPADLTDGGTGRSPREETSA